jgi:hypothetical protein
MLRTKFVRAYTVVILIFVALGVIIWLHGFVPQKAAQDLPWIMLLTLLVALPLAAPYLRSSLDYLRETFSEIRGPGGTGLSFRDPPPDVQPRTTDVESVEEAMPRPEIPTPSQPVEGQLAAPLDEEQTANAYLGIMTSAGMSVIQRVVEIERQGSELVFVGLGSGDRWLLPNLYFLALLLQAVTCVRELVFTHQVGGVDQVYAGMCPPSRLVQRIDARFPAYAAAARSLRDPHSDWPSFPDRFFNGLIEQSPDYPEISRAQIWVSVAALRNQVGIDFEVVEPIETSGTRTAPNWRAVFASPSRYVPVTENGRVQFVIDQWKWSKDVLRAQVTRSSTRSSKYTTGGSETLPR